MKLVQLESIVKIFVITPIVLSLIFIAPKAFAGKNRQRRALNKTTFAVSSDTAVIAPVSRLEGSEKKPISESERRTFIKSVHHRQAYKRWSDIQWSPIVSSALIETIRFALSKSEYLQGTSAKSAVAIGTFGSLGAIW